MPPEKSLEREMLEIVAYHDPIDSGLVELKLEERVDGPVDRESFKAAEDNLKELDLVERPGMYHEYFHITDKGWRHLGGETTRYGREIDPGTVAVCPVCAADEIFESDW